MKLQSVAALLIVAATSLWAQTSPPVASRPMPSRQRTAIATTTDADSKTAALRSQAAVNQRVTEMQTTLSRMHSLLKQMQGSAAVKESKDPMTKANLEMWSLMLQQLDKQFDQLRVAAKEREDLESRRAAMYKQADEKAAQAAQAAKAAQAAQAKANRAASQNTGSNAPEPSGSQAAPAAPAVGAPTSSSPN